MKLFKKNKKIDLKKILIILTLILAVLVAGVILATISKPKEDFYRLGVYFNNAKLDPEFSCNKVFPVERKVLRDQDPKRAVLWELLSGPTEDEKIEGFFTSINPGVKINSISVIGRTVRVDFDEQLGFQVGGSCRVAAISAEITQTLKQFKDIDNVIISINGRTEDTLQP